MDINPNKFAVRDPLRKTGCPLQNRITIKRTDSEKRWGLDQQAIYLSEEHDAGFSKTEKAENRKSLHMFPEQIDL